MQKVEQGRRGGFADADQPDKGHPGERRPFCSGIVYQSLCPVSECLLALRMEWRNPASVRCPLDHVRCHGTTKRFLSGAYPWLHHGVLHWTPPSQQWWIGGGRRRRGTRIPWMTALPPYYHHPE